MTNLKQQTHVSRIYDTFDRIENTKKKCIDHLIDILDR